MSKFTNILFAVCLSGCATVLPGDPAQMTPDQLKAAAKDRNSSVACSNGKTAAGNVTLIYVNADQGLRMGSTVTVKADCETIITTVYKLPPAKVAASGAQP